VDLSGHSFELLTNATSAPLHEGRPQDLKQAIRFTLQARADIQPPLPGAHGNRRDRYTCSLGFDWGQTCFLLQSSLETV